MQNVFSQLWNDDEGIVALEYLILATILGLGLMVGIATFTNAMVTQWVELANVVYALDHDISVPSFETCVSRTGGMNVNDVFGGPYDLTRTYPTAVEITQDFCPTPPAPNVVP